MVLKLSADGDYKKYATGGKNNGLENLMRLLEENGYSQDASLDGVLLIYRRN